MGCINSIIKIAIIILAIIGFSVVFKVDWNKIMNDHNIKSFQDYKDARVLSF